MKGMELRIFTEPQQGADYDTQLRVARASEDLGFAAFFRSDHYLRMGDVDGMPGPTDSWITLAGLARETQRIRLGTLVTAATFRLPGPLAIQVAQVDQMSGGRIDFGLGTGWYADEHTAYGIPFPEQKFARLTEQLAIVTGLWKTRLGDTFSFDGDHYQVTDSPALPKPVQQQIPVVLGGWGAQKTPQLAARYATEFNIPFGSIEDSAAQFGRVRTAVEQHGRASDDLVYSNALIACVGTTEAEIAQRAARIGRDVDELRANGLAGSPGEVVDKIARYREIGTERVYLQIMDLTDLDHLELIADRVATQL